MRGRAAQGPPPRLGCGARGRGLSRAARGLRLPAAALPLCHQVEVRLSCPLSKGPLTAAQAQGRPGRLQQALVAHHAPGAGPVRRLAQRHEVHRAEGPARAVRAPLSSQEALHGRSSLGPRASRASTTRTSPTTPRSRFLAWRAQGAQAEHGAQGQFIQTLHSEKVEPGLPPSGQRFILEGIFDPLGRPLPLSSMHEPDTLALLATSLALPVRSVRFEPSTAQKEVAGRIRGLSARRSPRSASGPASRASRRAP